MVICFGVTFTLERALRKKRRADRVAQQSLLNQLELVFEPVLDEANFGYPSPPNTNTSSDTVHRPRSAVVQQCKAVSFTKN